jgi:hypothetical protein
MNKLTTLHISGHANLKHLPPLESLPKLHTVFLGQLKSLEDLPSLSDLPSLQVVAFQAIPRVRTLPDLSIFESTLDTLVVQDMGVCCSGFLSSGVCDTSFPSCCVTSSSASSLVAPAIITNSNSINLAVRVGGASVNRPDKDSFTRSLLARDPPQCLDMPADSDLLPSNVSLAFLENFMTAESGTFCDPALASCHSFQTKVLPEGISADACKGVLYRECSSESKGSGICYNLELGWVQCVYLESVIAMRRAAIAAGCSCDSQEERWLGCQ